MARDYGTRRTVKKRSSAPQQFLVVIVTFFLGYLTATVFDVQKISHWMNTQVLEHEVKPEPVKTVKKDPDLPPKPKFEFYTLLANEKDAKAAKAAQASKAANQTAQTTTPSPAAGTAGVPTATMNAAVTAASKSNTPTPQQIAAVKVSEGKPLRPTQERTGAYLVQVAAFKTRHDAEHMKGVLTLKGFNVNVVPITNAQGNWFRVVIGPYPNRALAQKAQGTLASTEHLKGMITSYRG